MPHERDFYRDFIHEFSVAASGWQSDKRWKREAKYEILCNQTKGLLTSICTHIHIYSEALTAREKKAQLITYSLLIFVPFMFHFSRAPKKKHKTCNWLRSREATIFQLPKMNASVLDRLWEDLDVEFPKFKLGRNRSQIIRGEICFINLSVLRKSIRHIYQTCHGEAVDRLW